MNGFYNRFVHRRLNNDGLLTSATIRMLLLRSTGTYVFNPDHDFVADLFSNGGVEVTVASYSRKTLANDTITLDDANDRSVYDADNVPFGNLEVGQTVSAFVVYEFGTADSDSPMILHVDGKIPVVSAAPALAPSTAAITGATQANPVVITSNAHGLVNGEKVRITGVVGMTQINNLVFTVAGVTTNTFQLSGIDGTAYSAYTSGGTWTLVRKVYIEPAKDAMDAGASVSFSGSVGTLNANVAKGGRLLELIDLSGAVTEGVEATVQSSLNLPANLGGGAFNVNFGVDGFFAARGRI